MKRNAWTPSLACVVIFFLVAANNAAVAQNNGVSSTTDADEVAASLGLTKEAGSMPLWSEPSATAHRELGSFIRQAQQGVMLVGGPKGHGTAWVLSRKHRLLATNAHVADILHTQGKMLAIINGTTQVYTVKRTWYHPGVSRTLAGQIVRSSDPSDGDVYPLSPDVAVLELSADGPELPFEFTWATPDELVNPIAEAVAMLGFPGTDTAWPALGDQALATYHAGVVSRLSDFALSGHEPLQFLQYTMATWGGFSGSPVVLSNGHVVGIHNAARYQKDQGTAYTTQIAHGVRVDCLWELLAHHQLTDRVPIPVDPTTLNLDRWLQPDPRLENINQAERLVTEAISLAWYEYKFKDAVSKCNEAVKLAPGLATAHHTRGAVYRNYVRDRMLRRGSDRLIRKRCLEYLGYAEKDCQKAVQLDPTDSQYVIGMCYTLLSIASFDNDQQSYRQVIEILEATLSSGNLGDGRRAAALDCRGATWEVLGQYDRALADLNEAIRLAPNELAYWVNRAEFYQGRGKTKQAALDRAQAEVLRKQHLLSPNE